MVFLLRSQSEKKVPILGFQHVCQTDVVLLMPSHDANGRTFKTMMLRCFIPTALILFLIGVI